MPSSSSRTRGRSKSRLSIRIPSLPSVVAAEIDFKRDANGKVISLTLKQKGTCLARRATLSASGAHKRRVLAPDGSNLMIVRPQRNL
jgi:hypothetical protein